MTCVFMQDSDWFQAKGTLGYGGKTGSLKTDSQNAQYTSPPSKSVA